MYKEKRNINMFVELVDKMLDTKAKRTLWFNIIPLLEEDDQEYTKRKLNLSSNFPKTMNTNGADLNFANCLYEPGQPELYVSLEKNNLNKSHSDHTYGLIDAEMDNFFYFDKERNPFYLKKQQKWVRLSFYSSFTNSK